MKIGELAWATGLTTKTIRYYEIEGLIDAPERAEAGYRYFGSDDVERLQFIKKAKRLGFSLSEIKDILGIHEARQAPCVRVLDLLDQKLEQVDVAIRELSLFRQEIGHLSEESRERLKHLPQSSGVCGIIEHGIRARGEFALSWLGRRREAS